MRKLNIYKKKDKSHFFYSKINKTYGLEKLL